jgi:hypothetical protein
MSIRHRARGGPVRRCLRLVRSGCLSALIRARRAIRRHPVPVEVLLVDRTRRRALARDLRTALRQLRRVLGTTFPADLGVVVQQTLCAERPLVGCYELGPRGEGTRAVLVRLALSAGGRRLSTDELLAVLADQCVAIAAELHGPRVVVPVEVAAPMPGPAEAPAALRGDPLTPTHSRVGPAVPAA